MGLPYGQMKHEGSHPVNRRWRAAPVTVLLAAGAAWILVLARFSFTWHTRYRKTLLALSTLEESKRIKSLPVRSHLIHFAASLLGAPAGVSSQAAERSRLIEASIHTLHNLASTQWFVAPPLWVIGFVAMAVSMFWLKEGRLAALEFERGILKEQLLAIARGWASLATNPDGRQVMQNILSELTAHTAVTAAAIYRLTEVKSNCLELYVSFGDISLSQGPIPKLFLEPERGLVGEALAFNQPRYTGDYAEAGYLIPGTRMPRVAVFPARYHERNWGILMLSSNQAGWFYTYRDVLEVLAQEVALAAASADMAEQSRRHQRMEDRARMQSDILANVSHELRTPLGLIKGYLETLQTSESQLSTEDRRDFLSVAVQETQELELLIEQLLTMSRMESAETPHRPQWFTVDAWIAQALARHPVWDRKRIQVVTSRDGELVFGDRRNLTTVLSSLLENALKYSVGVVEVHINILSNSWSLGVRDHGPGVAPDVVDRVFERFYRAPEHAQSEIRGSGLGLSIAKRIVEMHGGDIWADNAPGGGFMVTARLPRGDAAKREDTARGRRRISSSHR